MTTTQIVLLNQTQWKIPSVVHAVQGDTGRTLKMVIADQILPSSSTATLSIHRSDDSYYEIDCTFVQSDNAFTANITQALTQYGITECQLIVSGDVSAYLFLIDVQKAAQGIPETQEGYTINEAVNRAEEVLAELDDVLIQVSVSGDTLIINTNSQSGV